MSRAKRSGDPTGRRESIWSIPAGWRVAYFALFSVSSLALTFAIVGYKIANRGDAHPVELLVSIAESVSVVGIALAITTVSVMEVVQFPMVLANYVRVKLVEPLKEQLRAEGREQGIEQGLTQANAAWREWNERRLKAEADGVLFDEPPPDVG